MTLDTQLRTRLTSAVGDTAVPPGLAQSALAGGRRRRRARAAAVVALATAAVVGGALLLPDGGPSASDDARIADRGSEASTVALKWARSLPQGAAPSVPFYGAGGLWSDGDVHAVPDSVNLAYPPRTVAGGWLVLLGQDESRLALAVLAADGSLRDLPAGTFAEGFGDARVEVSADGRRVAYGVWVVDLETMQTTEVPHQPESDEQGGYYTAIRMVGFTDDGLVYEGAPFEQGRGATWLLRDDGSSVEVDPPGTSHIGDGNPADVALAFDYAADNSDTCTTSYVLRDDAWGEDGYGCMGHYLGEALTVSSDRQWLVTDDLPEVWNLQDGAWRTVEMPEGVGKAQMDAQMGGVVWETADSFLLPVADRWAGDTSPEPSFEQQVQVVRCTMSTGTCERAGDEQDITVTSTMWGTTELRFATS